MSIQKTSAVTAQIPGIPTRRSEATVYHHAKAVVKLVNDTRERVAQLDNLDGVDLNGAAGSVLLEKAGMQAIEFAPTARNQGVLSFATISCEYSDGPSKNLEAELRDSDGNEAKVRYSETPTHRQYSVDAAYWPGEMVVREDKASSARSLAQENAFPGVFELVATDVRNEITFAPTGPESLDSTNLYRCGTHILENVEQQISALKKLDNGVDDLNPDPGTVVIAGYANALSDNWKRHDFESPYTIPTEAQLVFDPSSGTAKEMSQGFANSDILSYRRSEDGAEHFFGRRNFTLFEVTRKPDQTLTVREQSSERLSTLDRNRRYSEGGAAWE